jgi:hypothetical protein
MSKVVITSKPIGILKFFGLGSYMYALLLTEKEIKQGKAPIDSWKQKYYIELGGRRLPIKVVSEEEYNNTEGEIVG